MSRSEEMYVVTGADGPALRALRRELQLPPDAATVVDEHLGRRREHPPLPGHVCPEHDPLGYARRALAAQDELEADSYPETILASGSACHRARVLLALEAHVLPLLGSPGRAYSKVFLVEASARSPRKLLRRRIENNVIRREHERDGSPIVLVPRGSTRERAAFVRACVDEVRLSPASPAELRRATQLPPVLSVERDEPLPLLGKIQERLAREGLAPPGELLLRVTEGLNLELVRMHGTDRAHRDRPMRWEERGYEGEERAFADVIYATRARDVGRGKSALDKLAETPEPLVLAYDLARFDQVRRREYAFKDRDRRAALVAILRVVAP